VKAEDKGNPVFWVVLNHGLRLCFCESVEASLA
jgi:hypothetical protein